MSNNLFRRLLETASGAPFMVVPAHVSGSGEDRRISYGEVVALSGRLAQVLRQRGVMPGERVAVQVEKSVEAIALYFACLKAGAIYLPLNTAYTLTELEYFIGDAEPRLVVCDGKARAGVETIARRHGGTVETLGAAGDGSLTDAAHGMSSDFPVVARQASDLAAILYTSGTTGRSKGAMLSHGNLESNADTLIDIWRVTRADVLLHALPIYHTHGLFVATNTLALAGGSMLVLPRFDADSVFATLPRATMMMGVPTFYTRLLQDDRLTRQATEHVRLFISGSAPLLAETHRAFTTRTGHEILERYGMTETNMLTSNLYEGPRVPGSVGVPLPGVDLRITDAETGVAVADGSIGMIEVTGPNVFQGYWRMPEKTRAEFRDDGYFITGDLGVRQGDGSVTIVGRGKDLIITGGFNVYPKEIESEIDAIDGVMESAVIGVPHADFGEGVTAVVVTKAGATVDEARVLGALEGRLAKFKCPKRVLIVASLPRNAMGKVLKAELRNTYHDLYQPHAQR